jgi:2-desacetyl-2-hydroxyethyl bacteriochlorophyllide A dehydrogenase
MTEQTRTAVLGTPRKFQLLGRPKPTAGPGTVVVQVAATAVCHTDLEIYTGRHPGVRYPVVMGHEATGTVEAVGPGVTNVKTGQHVIINPIISCGRCDMCQRGAENLCRNAGLFGREVDGSLREFVSLEARYVQPLHEKLPLASATLIETLATVKHAQDRVEIKSGESVVVLGQGTTGLLHTRLAVLVGANPVIAVSRTKWKLDMATRMGAHHAIDTDADAAVSEVMRVTGGKGADVVIDTVGNPTTPTTAIEMLRPGGRLSPYAICHEAVPGFTTFPLYYKEISIIGSRALLPRDLAPAVELVASGKVDVGGFVTATYPLARTAEAFEEYERNPGKILRIVIDSQSA